MTSVTLSFQYDPGPNQPVDMSASVLAANLPTPGGELKPTKNSHPGKPGALLRRYPALQVFHSEKYDLH